MLAALLLALATTALASPYPRSTPALLARENDGANVPNVVRSTFDGQCYYPTADETFHLESYLGKWYQIAGTLAPFTAGCGCITAEYSLNVGPF